MARSLLASVGLIGGLAILAMSAISMTAPDRVSADGAGSSVACLGMTAGVTGSVTGTGDLVTYDAGSGNIVSGVCIKSGVEVGHTGVLGNGLTADGCYQISGVGTQTVTVTRVNSQCQGISHIDVVVGTSTPTATPTGTATATMTATATPTTTATATITATATSTATATATATATRTATATTTATASPTVTRTATPAATTPSGVMPGGGSPGATGVLGAVPRPPSTGNAGLAGDSAGLPLALWIGLTGIGLAGARLVTARSSAGRNR